MENKLCVRIDEFPKLIRPEEIDYYRDCEKEWRKSGCREVNIIQNRQCALRVGVALRQVLDEFRKQTQKSSITMEENFVIKMLFWIDQAVGTLFQYGEDAVQGTLIYNGVEKKQENLFCRLLELSGITVIKGEERERKELTYEELAKLAPSVVKIIVCDRIGNELGSGSGIMIGKAGYILTNHHVACQGSCYHVRIEEDDNIYETDELIKYNQQLDLAVIRIDRTLTPLAIYGEKEPLIRGQKVVAIGSPLGLFNTISDGIISGFRNIRDVDMIQFTAPISRGSSGGALLNMYGELIGISTSGIDDGQNINFAVTYEEIKKFVQGFCK